MGILEGKTALVTGASRGIGRAIAVKLASEGCKVAVVYRGSTDAADETVKLCTEYGVEAKSYMCDVASFSETEALVKSVTSDLGGIDILVNNAGVTSDKLVLGMTEDDFDKVVNTNLKGAFNLIKHTYRGFMKKKYGKIINISSVSGLMGNPGQANYSASKAGIIGLTKTVAKELAGRNINVNAIAPGFIATDMTEKFAEDENVLKSIPMGHIGKTEDIANLALFLSSPMSDYITGETIRVDGGMAM